MTRGLRNVAAVDCVQLGTLVGPGYPHLSMHKTLLAEALSILYKIITEWINLGILYRSCIKLDLENKSPVSYYYCLTGILKFDFSCLLWVYPS